MPKPVRVLRIVGAVVSGGIDTITMNYYRSLDRDKIQMDFIFDGYDDTHLDEEIQAMGGRIYKVEPYAKNMLKNMRQIYRVVRENGYDIVHSHLNSLSVFPLCAAWLGGAKIRIASNHSTSVKGETKKNLMKNALRPFAKVFPTHYAACSQHAGQWLFGKEFCREGHVRYLKNAIDLEKFRFNPEVRQSVRRELDLEGRFVVGHVGRFAFQKNHAFVVEVFAETLRRRPDALLLLVGDGPLRDEMEALCQRKGIRQSVRFLGVRQDVSALMQAMDVFLFPSHYEGLGNVITEAQAAATMSLVSEAVPEEIRITEYVDGMNLSQSAAEWADQVLRYAEGYPRRDTSEDLREKGYDIKQAAQELADYYLDLRSQLRQPTEALEAPEPVAATKVRRVRG